MEEETCALCQIKLPEFNKDGKHNFVPHIVGGKVQNLCMKCKMLLTQAKFRANHKVLH